MDNSFSVLSLGSADPESILDVDFGRLNPLFTRIKELDQEYRTSGNVESLEAAIEKSWEAVNSAHNDKPGIRTSCLLYLSYLLKDRYTATNNIEDLDKSIDLAGEANGIANALEEVHPQHPLVLKALRARLTDRYALTGSESDLDRAVDTARQSIDITNDGASDVSNQYGDLSALLGRRYLATGTVENVDEAISMGWKAIEGEVTDNESMRLHLLAHIGSLLGHKSLRTGSLADMDEGVRLARQAVEEASEEEPALADSLNSLATLLGQRYSLTSALIDINEAIDLARRSLKIPSYNSTMLATSLGNLAVFLQLRYQRSRELPDLEESTQLSQRALNTMPDNHPDRSRHQHDIGIKLARKFTTTNDMKDLDDGIQSLREAVDNTPKSHPYRAIFLHSLANVLIQKGSETFDGDGVDEWISVAKEALQATPESHPDRGELLYGLGLGLLAAHATGKTLTGIDEAIPCFEAAIKQSNAPPLCRIQACMCLLPICHDRQRSLDAAKLVVGLIPRIIPRQQDNSDRQSSLAELAGFTSDAVAVAIQAGQVVDALELLEQGQGLLGASAEQMQTDIVDLEKAHPEYAAEFDRLRKEINRPVDPDISATQTTALREGLALRLYDAGREFDELVEKIRKLPNFDTFLQTPGLDEMQDMTNRGPIIILNISVICCDAIIIMIDRIYTVPLVDLSRADIEEKVLSGERGSPDALEWLWDTIVCPVLDRIGFSNTPTGDNWPHVWWIPTGLLKQFPLHAAGYHRKRTKETTLDRVVSSYASSVKAMIQARKRRKSTRETNKAVLVAMETTPTLSRLAFANQEVEVVKDACSSIGLEVVEPERRKAALVEQLRQCKFFHFAGHGCTDPQDPLRSYLCLEDVVTNPLRVGGLLDLNLKDQPPFLAYLSACGTGRIQQEQFMDESVHLISAFQLAGFQHVIGTLWEVNDRVCVDIAKVVYGGIKDGQMSDRSVAWGLHEASRRLRDKWLGNREREGSSRGADDDVLNNLIIREPVVHGVRWERRRVRKRAKAKGMSRSLGTRWRRVSTKASRNVRVSKKTMSGVETRGQRWSREASLAILLRHKIEPSPAWVPFIHYGI
jgi:tetratricopeptide (TPR) repeat protein